MWLMLASAFALTPPDSGIEILPVWMAGCWEEVSASRWTEECWTQPRGGMMIGSSRTGVGQRVESFEHMRLEGLSGTTNLCALPNGQEGACFEKAKETATEIIFVNAGHDYPQRIRYWRDGKFLMAETSLSDGTKAQRWKFAPMGN